MKNINSKLLIVAIILLSFFIYQTFMKKDSFQDPENLISETEASEMSKLYINNQYKFINKGLNDNFNASEFDNIAFSISIESLKAYINYAEKIAEKENYKNLGIRFHLGAKLNDSKIPFTSLYYNTIGVSNSDSTPFPIKYEDLKVIKHIFSADRIGTTNNPPTKEGDTLPKK